MATAPARRRRFRRQSAKGIEAAKKNLFKINLTETTIPHQVLGHFGAGEVMLKPAPEGTGVIAGEDGSRRHDLVRYSECAHEVARHREPAQRDQGDVSMRLIQLAR